MQSARLFLLKNTLNISKGSCSSIHTSQICKKIDKNWREDNGLDLNPNAFGPLTNLPDYTFMDGRPTPLGSHQRQRIVKQRQLAARIVTLCRELDFAKERQQRIVRSKEEHKQQIISNKLKPKGHLLLKK